MERELVSECAVKATPVWEKESRRKCVRPMPVQATRRGANGASAPRNAAADGRSAVESAISTISAPETTRRSDSAINTSARSRRRGEPGETAPLIVAADSSCEAGNALWPATFAIFPRTRRRPAASARRTWRTVRRVIHIDARSCKNGLPGAHVQLTVAAAFAVDLVRVERIQPSVWASTEIIPAALVRQAMRWTLPWKRWERAPSRHARTGPHGWSGARALCPVELELVSESESA